MRRVDGDLAGQVGSIGELTLDAETGRLRVDVGSGSGSSNVNISSVGGNAVTTSIPVSGPLTNAQLTAVTGTAAQTAVTVDPAAAGQTILAVLRGILAEMQAQTVLLNDIKTNTTPTP
ncbi:hypothetical protein QEZ48_19680 [Aquamicrobium lusatiense]|uniref:hypothetical protein n=1 Tax=Aquamicrobium lusatiense TaxID=89772 RepID=UPI002456D920|nr:hypothetical protein [Aquamicrobium lusatiense]MDH4993039.1 hypothetical protein [Aquamicrobium lusatiense]